MVTRHGWKLIRYPGIGVDRLSHLEKDPHELTDLAKGPEFAPKLAELSALLESLAGAVDDPLGV